MADKPEASDTMTDEDKASAAALAAQGDGNVGVASALDFVITEGTNEDDTLTGTEADDYISGKKGNDTLAGEGGFDVLSGGDDNDSTDTGVGIGVHLGGKGADTFVIGDDMLGTDSTVVAGDFSSADGDRLELGEGIQDGIRNYAEGGGDLTITDGADFSAVIDGLDAFSPPKDKDYNKFEKYLGTADADGTIADATTIEVTATGDQILVAGATQDAVIPVLLGAVGEVGGTFTVSVAEKEGGELSGTDANDYLVGGKADDILLGLGGVDVASGSSGNDSMDTGEGIGVHLGGKGADAFTITDEFVTDGVDDVVVAGDIDSAEGDHLVLGEQMTAALQEQFAGGTETFTISEGADFSDVIEALQPLTDLKVDKDTKSFLNYLDGADADGNIADATTIDVSTGDQILVAGLTPDEVLPLLQGAAGEPGGSFAVSVADKEGGELSGTDANDYLVGSKKDDTLLGEGGVDIASGQAGNDTTDTGGGLGLHLGGKGEDTFQIGDEILTNGITDTVVVGDWDAKDDSFLFGDTIQAAIDETLAGGNNGMTITQGADLSDVIDGFSGFDTKADKDLKKFGKFLDGVDDNGMTEDAVTIATGDGDGDSFIIANTTVEELTAALGGDGGTAVAEMIANTAS